MSAHLTFQRRRAIVLLTLAAIAALFFVRNRHGIAAPLSRPDTLSEAALGAPGQGVSPAPAPQAYRFVTMWRLRFMPGMVFDLDGPGGVAVDLVGNLYVADTEHNRILKFSADNGPVIGWGSAGSGAGEFSGPEFLAVDQAGYLYVADKGNFRIQKFTLDGAFVTAWGSQGDGEGQFERPRGIAIDEEGYVYVADFWGDRIQKFTSNGTFVAAWGSYGTGNGQFAQPAGVAVLQGYLYVADTYNHRIQKYTLDGSFVAAWGSRGSADGQFLYPDGLAVSQNGDVYVTEGMGERVQKFTSSGGFVTKWGGSGQMEGEFSVPSDLAVDHLGHVYVADTWNDRVQKFTSDGVFLGKWGPASAISSITYYDTYQRPSYSVNGSGALLKRWLYSGVKLDRTLAYPTEPHEQAAVAISVNNQGSVYAAVVDLGDRCIQEFGVNGEWITEWCGGKPDSSYAFWALRAIATDPAEAFYVCDSYVETPYNQQGWPMGVFTRFRVRRLGPDGSVLAEWQRGYSDELNEGFSSSAGSAVDQHGRVYMVVTKKHTVWRFDPDGAAISWGGEGSAEGQFLHPEGITVAPDGSVYVADSGNNRIQKFTADGVFVSQWGSPGTGEGQFNWPLGIALDQSGAVYVTEVGGNRAQKFTSTGSFVTQWGSLGTGEGQFDRPGGIAVDSDGYVYVLDSGNNRIQKFESFEAGPTPTPTKTPMATPTRTPTVTPTIDPATLLPAYLPLALRSAA